MTDNKKAAASDIKKATAATFGRVSSELGKFSIKSLEPGSSIVVHAQFNPKELSIDKEVPWAVPGDAGGGNGNTKQGSGGIEMQFTGAKGRSFTVELLFDGVDQADRANVMTSVKNLETLATVINPASKTEAERRPHWCVATWGAALPRFTCVITKLGTKYEMFDAQGNPVRVRCSLTLSEASSVSIKDKNKKPKPPTPTTPAGGAPAGGAPAGGAPAGGAPAGGAPAGGAPAGGAPAGGTPRPATPPRRP
jgi:hypothetical protein